MSMTTPKQRLRDVKATRQTGLTRNDVAHQFRMSTDVNQILEEMVSKYRLTKRIVIEAAIRRLYKQCGQNDDPAQFLFFNNEPKETK
jgi:hypothetical protein